MALIYIIEDDDSIREIEELALINAGHKVLGFSCAKDFYDKMNDVIPDLCLVDIMLPDEDGYSVLNKIRMSPMTRDLPVILVTAKVSEIDTVKGLDAGADDYIAKPFGIMELISRVRALLRRAGKDPVREQLILDGLVLDPGKRMCYAGDRQIDLTYKEYELLYCLMRNAGMVMKRDVLMEKIWGIDYEGGSRTLDAHIKSLRKKLGEEGSHIRTVRNVGYLAR